MAELPSDEDRRRVLGCLAVILASSYDYDVVEENPKIDDDSYKPSDFKAKVDDGRNDSKECNKQGFMHKSNDCDNGKDSGNDIGIKKSSFTIDLPGRKNSKKQRERQNMIISKRRRHEVACDFLLSAADFLFLSKSEAEILLPLLDTMLFASNTNTAMNSQNEILESSHAESWEVVQYPWELQGNELVKDEALRLPIAKLSADAGFRCLTLLLFQYLINAKEGYDSRIRQALKRLGVAILVHNMDAEEQWQRSSCTGDDYGKVVAYATRKYESLEHVLAGQLLAHAHIHAHGHASIQVDSNKSQYYEQNKPMQTSSQDPSSEDRNKSAGVNITKEQIVRGFKIGSAGIVAGTLLFVSGGVAIPGILAGLSAIGLGMDAFAGAFLAYASSSAALSLFGAAGGSVAMYKMNRRTKGLTEFDILREGGRRRENKAQSSITQAGNNDVELHRTICISGWLRDACDFQRPWGVSPTNPPISDKHELLERFYSLFKPDNVSKAKKILKLWKGEEVKLWGALKDNYKADPESPFPLNFGPVFDGQLSNEEENNVKKMIVEITNTCIKDIQRDEESNRNRCNKKHYKIFKRFKKWFHGADKVENDDDTIKDYKMKIASLSDMQTNNENELSPTTPVSEFEVKELPCDSKSIEIELSPPISEFEFEFEEVPCDSKAIELESSPKHLSTVWDHRANYGGELYTIKWESDVILEISASAQDLAVEFMEKAGKEVLKRTVFSTIINATALPTAVISAMDGIDAKWTLVMERSAAAGKELAKSLLENSNVSGHRPVTLVGYSFGARVIYFCLLELARLQDEWLQQQETENAGSNNSDSNNDSSTGIPREKNETKQCISCEPASIIEDAILMGMPEYLKLKRWKKCRQIVAGRLVNVYSRNDILLGFLFRYKNILGCLKLRPICGNCTVAVSGVENVNVTDIVNSHSDYCLLIGDILKRIRFGQPLRSEWNAVDEMALISQPDNMLPGVVK